MAYEHFDVFVIGSGIAGQTCAKECAKAGLKVAIADNREFGGTCSQRGCDPKKVIYGLTHILQRSRDMQGKGISQQPDYSWEGLMKFKCSFTDAIPAVTEEKLEDLDITLYHQSPEFIDEKTISVEGKTVTADKFVIATGLIPRQLKFDGCDMMKTSDDFLELESLPETMIFIGAGYIGMEFAHMASRCGVDVTVIQRSERPLPVFDIDMVNHLTKASEELGINFIFEADVQNVEKLRKNYRVEYKKDGKVETIKAELIFNTAGRVPALDELLLEKGKVSFNKNGVEVSRYLQNPKNKNVYACGDVSDHAVPLTPFSGREGKVVANNILAELGKDSRTREKISFPPTPSVCFTIPNVASVGISESEAKTQKLNVTIKAGDGEKWYNAKRINTKIYAFKTIVDADSGKLLGAHLIGPEAGEVINLFSMAIYNKMTVSQIKDMVYAYPSWGSDIGAMV